MATRSGGPPIKNVRKVKPGPDQAFTLPKGTSAAPIMQVKFKRVKPKGQLITRGQQHGQTTSPYEYTVPGTNIKIWESGTGWKAKGSKIDVIEKNSLKEVKEAVVKKLK